MLNLHIFFLSVFAIFSQQTKTNSGPLVSATDPFYLSCTTWNGHAWTPVTARSAQTSESVSSKGFRAYAEVQVAVAKDGSCENTTELFVAAPGQDGFKLVYSVAPSTSDGNGIRLIGWSPSGDKLLAELNEWRYETDGGFGHVPLLYDSLKGSAEEIPALSSAIVRHFGESCEFDFAVQRWKSDDQLIVKVTKALEDPTYEQHFCLQRPRLFIFDLSNKKLQASGQP